MALMLYDPPNLLVLDEPTNHLDMATKEMLIAALANYEGTMLFVSHDRHFLAALSNRVLELTPDGVHQYGGGYTEYVARTGQSARRAGAAELTIAGGGCRTTRNLSRQFRGAPKARTRIQIYTTGRIPIGSRTRMRERVSNIDNEDLRLLAEQAGLKRALEKFPDGVKAAAERGLRPVGAMPAGNSPITHPGACVQSRAVRARQMTDLAWLSVAEGAQLLRAQKLSPVEWTKALLDRIAAVDPAYNAFLIVTAERALAQAKPAETEIAAGHWRGPMHGVPYAAKDIFDVEGMATTCHSKIRKDHRAAADAFVIRKLRDAGAVLLGKLALHEFATGGPAFDLPWPPARNPWNRDLHPGGSSSGSGAALAAGLAPAALGTDTGGSVRNPATCCGIVGLKPTYGAVSLDGVFPLTYSLDHVGPMTRSVEDNAILLPRHRRPRSRTTRP